MSADSKLNAFIIVLIVALSVLYIHDFKTSKSEFFEPKKKDDSSDNKKDNVKKDRKKVTKYFEWKYNGKKYSLSLNFDKSTYFYYKNNRIAPMKIEEGVTYRKLLQHGNANGLFTRLTDRLMDKALNNKLTQDQLAELTVSFVQSIPYDERLASKVENLSALPKHPYEVLYEKSGICSGKSFLVHVLLDELGFGTCLFVFDEADHMMAGIKCPKKHSKFNSGYCYIESTSYHPIGFASIEFEKLNIENLVTKYSINLVTSWNIKNDINGKEYTDIEKNINLLEKLKNIKIKRKKFKALIDEKSERLKGLKDNIDQLKTRMERFKRLNKRIKYNRYANKYNNLVSRFKRIKGVYNQLSDLYNRKGRELEALVDHLLIQKGRQ